MKLNVNATDNQVNTAALILLEEQTPRETLHAPFPNGSFIPTDSEALSNHSDFKHAFLLNSNPESWIQTIRTWLTAPDRRLTIRIPLADTYLLQQAFELPDSYAMSTPRIINDIVEWTIKQSTPDDLDIQSFKKGYDLGHETARIEAPPQTRDRHDEFIQSLESYRSLLETAKSFPEGTLGPVEPKLKTQSSAASDEPLIHELTKVRRELDVLQRKYDALASSRLGSLTLRLWERRSDRRKGKQK